MYMSASAPEAPPFNETTIGCFIRLFFWMAAWIMRAIWSEAPPAPAATTISTGLVGSHAAAAPLASTSPASAPANRPKLFLMSLLLIDLLPKLRRLAARGPPSRLPQDRPSPPRPRPSSPALQRAPAPSRPRRGFP